MSWDNFDEDIKAGILGSGGNLCTVSRFLNEIGEDGRKAVEAAINNPNRPATAIAKALRVKVEAMGIDVKAPGDFIITRHRRGECKCPKRAL